MALTEAHCCRLLGLSAAATLEETRSAYRRIARQMHPDRAGGDGDHFKEITAAYNWLVARRCEPMADDARPAPTRRSAPDDAARRTRARRAWQQARSREAQRAWAAAQAARAEADQAAERARAQAEQARLARQRARAAKRKAREAERARVETRWDEDFTDAWEAWCKTAERYHAQSGADAGPAAAEEPRPWSPRTFEPEAGRPDASGASEPTSIFGRVRQSLRRVTRRAALDRVGHDVSLRLPVGPELLMKGGTRTVAITRAAACPSCQGAGDARCVCGGEGRIKLRETIKVSVPPGARAGARLRLEGKGTAGLDGGPDGDLFLLVEPEPIPGFRLDGLDLHGRVVLGGRLAGAGGTVAVELPGGKVKLDVPPGSRAGDRFRLRGQGIPSWGGAERGDLFLSVVIR